MTYPLSFRQKILAVRKRDNLTIAQTSERFSVGIASITRWIKEITPKTTRNKPATKIDMKARAEDVKSHPDAYHYERAQRCNVSERAIGFALKRLGITYKKSAQTSQSRRREAVFISRED